MELKIEYIAVEDLKPYERNTRKHCEEDVEGIIKSIEKCGFNDPIGIWSDKNIIVEGHGRLMAAKQLGMETVPCIRLDHLDDKGRREYAILHNATAELSIWDKDFLAMELPELDLDDFNFDFGIDTDAEEEISPDEFGEDFSLPDGDKPEICQMTFTIHQQQKELIEYALSAVKDEITETFGNTNSNGNALYEVIRQWAEQRK